MLDKILDFFIYNPFVFFILTPFTLYLLISLISNTIERNN